ncbi:MAG TPA: hypothetical protein ENN20_03250 [Candidatus Marinimicrobia bacterium]|nr:hypothetical protein [Candidatus Neomarinimicrobiota bacterium]
MNSTKEQLRQSLLLERQANFLKLIPGVVHNLCNPLTIIGTRAQLLQLKMPESPDFRKMVEQSKMIESILNNLVFISQNQCNTQIQKIDINKLIENETDFLTANPHFKHNITREIQYYSGNLSVKSSYFHVASLVHFTLLFLIDCAQNSTAKNLWISCEQTHQVVLIRIRTDIADLADQSRQFEKHLSDPDSPAATSLKNLACAALIAKEMKIALTFPTKNENAEFLITIPKNE